jgi:putative DNA primase/helicase
MSGANAILAIVDAAPVFTGEDPGRGQAMDPVVTADAVRRFGLAELEAARAAVGATEGDARSPALSAAAERMGALAAAGALDEALVKAVLEKAALECGLIRDDGAKAVKAAIAAGIKRGKKTPADLAEVRGAVQALRAPHDQSRTRQASDHVPSLAAEGAGPDTTGEPSSSSSSASTSASLPPVPPIGEENALQTLANDAEDDAENGGDGKDSEISDETFRFCASLDQSDVDNGQRLISYFGRDLLVRQEDDVPAGQMMAWTGTHWDLAGGEALAHLIGQKVGDLIKREADYIDATPVEARAIGAGEKAAKELKALPPPDGADALARIDALEDLVAAAKKARAGLYARRGARRKWGISTKNAGRIAAMLKCAAPHLRRHPDAFNADQLKVATLTHTLSFVPVIDQENPDPDSTRLLVDRDSGRVQYRLKAVRGHDRDDMLTAVIPYAYDPKAKCPDFDVFLDLFQPEPKKRRTVQQYSGMSLTAQPVQRIMFHTGTGGNGKSVFLEVLARVLGDGLAVGVPAESVSGQVQNNPARRRPTSPAATPSATSASPSCRRIRRSRARPSRS